MVGDLIGFQEQQLVWLDEFGSMLPTSSAVCQVEYRLFIRRELCQWIVHD